MTFSYHDVKQMNIIPFFKNSYFIFQLLLISCLIFRKNNSKTFASTSHCFEEIIHKDWNYVFKRWMDIVLISRRTPLWYRGLMNTIRWSRLDGRIERSSSPGLWIRPPPRFLSSLKLSTLMLSEACLWNLCFWHIF